MKLIALEMPESPAELGIWLEQQVLGIELSALVAQLQAVHGEPSVKRTLKQVLGRERRPVLEKGLSCLDPERLREFLIQPELLFDLQELVCIEGQAYWKTLPMSREMQDTLMRHRFRLHGAIRLRESDPRSAGPRYKVGIITQILRLVAVAAIVVIGLGIWQVKERRLNVTVARGWLNPDVVKDNVSGKEFLLCAADAADVSFSNLPSSRAELADRLHEIRRGCSNLLLAPKTKLTPDQALVFNRFCQKWAKDLDQNLEELEAQEGDIKRRDPNDVRHELEVAGRSITARLRTMAAS